MSQKAYNTVTGLIFLAVALAHLYRILAGLAVQIGNFSVPFMGSWIGFVFAAYLAYAAFTIKRK